jgi:hypothetical protein
MTLSPELLNAIEAGCDGVTPGPWVVLYDVLHSDSLTEIVSEDRHIASTGGTCPDMEANAAHIARLDPATALELVAGYRAWLKSEERNKLYRQALSSADAFTATLNPNLLPEGAAQQWEATREALRRAEVPHV